MIKSMTGFGRCEIEEDNRKITVEIKSVNHRYLDVNVKLPKKLSFFESAVRNLIKEYIQRGKVDIFITCEDFNEANFSLKYNEELAGEYLKYLQQMAEHFQLENDIRVSTLSRYPDVFIMEEQEGTVMKALMAEYKDTYALSVSATTRNPRPGEVDGVDYFFRTQRRI